VNNSEQSMLKSLQETLLSQMQQEVQIIRGLCMCKARGMQQS